MYNFGFLFRLLLVLLINFSSRQYSYGQQSPADGEARINLQLSRGAFGESYHLILRREGSDAVTDADALQLGEGFVALAGVAAGGTRLSIDERRADTDIKTVKLYVKGWSPGDYTLRFNFNTVFLNAYTLTLVDTHLQLSKTITAADTVYTFSMGNKAAMPDSSRFKLLLKPIAVMPPAQPKDASGILIYPNPFHASLYVSTPLQHRSLCLRIRDFSGRLQLETNFITTPEPYQLATGHFMPGPYLIELFDQKTGLRIKSLKTIKQYK